MRQVAITTIDNPYDYFDQFDEWLAYDMSKGYGTLEYLSRVSYSSNDLSLSDEMEAIEQAIDEIIVINVPNIYKKIIKDVK